MSTSVTTITVLCNIPKLSVNGDNSVIRFIRFIHAVKSKGVWPHLDGSAICSQPPAVTTGPSGAPGTVPTAQGPPTVAGVPPINPAVAKYEEDLEKWEKDKALTDPVHPELNCCLHIDSEDCCSYVG